MSIRLFVYGTLRQGRAPAEIAATVARLRPLGRAVAYGQMYDLGAYPGASFAIRGTNGRADSGIEGGCTEIEGDVYEVPDARVWKDLDAYEGFERECPAASLFVRREIDVRMIDGGEKDEVIICWAYEYNRPTEIALLHNAPTNRISLEPKI